MKRIFACIIGLEKKKQGHIHNIKSIKALDLIPISAFVKTKCLFIRFTLV